jgi:molybdopterin-guanine dinucleotide biosynthesis protein A
MLKYSVVILAGGKSSRMGEDKALSPFVGEKTLIDYILQQINGLGCEQLIIANDPDSYRRFGLPVLPDILPGIGALGGIYSALFHAAYDYSVILACDMPFVNHPLIKHMLKLAPEYDAVIPRWKPGEFAEPFRAIYSKDCIIHIKRAIEEDNCRVLSFFGDVNIRFLEADELSHFDPTGLTFFNVNTPEELDKARRLVEDFNRNFYLASS